MAIMSEGDALVTKRREAGERLAGFAAGLERLGLEDLRRSAISTQGQADQVRTRKAAETIVESAGLGSVLEEARASFREYVLRVYAAGAYQWTIAGLNWGRSTGRAEDQATMVQVVQDAALGVIAEPFAPPEVVSELLSPFDLVLRGRQPGADSLVPPLLDSLRVGPWGGPMAVVIWIVVLLMALGAFPVLSSVLSGLGR